MKIRYAVLFVMAIFAGLCISPKAIAGNGGRSSNGDHGGLGGIPLPSGLFSETVQGSLAICLNPTSFAEESCSTSGALVIPLSSLANGVDSYDNQGNTCSALTEVDSNLPVDASSPTVTANEHIAGQMSNYDSVTGTGDGSFTGYTGGSCNGAIFDNSGATKISTGTTHFVVTHDGSRIDFLLTALTNPTSSIGDFSLSGTDLRQTRPEF